MDTTTDGSAVIGHGRAEGNHARLAQRWASSSVLPIGAVFAARAYAVYAPDTPDPTTAAAIDSAQAQRAAARRSLKLRTAPRLLSVKADICAAMVQRGYLQSCASTRQRWETILPPVMAAPMAMECQILSVKGNHRRIRPNAAKAAMEPHHAIIGARWCCRADPKHQQPNCKS
jgi:hypothetical protein